MINGYETCLLCYSNIRLVFLLFIPQKTKFQWIQSNLSWNLNIGLNVPEKIKKG